MFTLRNYETILVIFQKISGKLVGCIIFLRPSCKNPICIVIYGTIHRISLNKFEIYKHCLIFGLLEIFVKAQNKVVIEITME